MSGYPKYQPRQKDYFVYFFQLMGWMYTSVKNTNRREKKGQSEFKAGDQDCSVSDLKVSRMEMLKSALEKNVKLMSLTNFEVETDLVYKLLGNQVKYLRLMN